MRLLAERALDSALELTHSPTAFVSLVAAAGTDHEVYSRTADESGTLPQTTIDRLAGDIVASGASHVVNDLGPTRGPAADRPLKTFLGVPLKAGGDVIGTIGVVNGAGYNALDEKALSMCANQVASAIEVVRLRQRRQEMVDALVNLRADLDRSEKQRLINEERAHTAERLEKAHELAIEALLAVSRHIRSGDSLTEFYSLLTATVAKLVGADQVLFWEVRANQTLNAIPGGYGVDEAFISRLYPAACDPDGSELPSQVVYKDLTFRAALDDRGESPHRNVLELLQVASAISVPWRAGDNRLGVVAAYNSHRADGFSMEDAWLLQTSGLAAGLVWQLKQAEGELNASVERLQRVDAARQLLLRNLSTAADKATRRFAAELHDDALQKLTAAELQLQRVRESLGNASLPRGMSDAQALLVQVEEALRKLLFDVRPPVLDSPGGLEETIHDRLALLRSLTGIEAEVNLDLPQDLPREIKSLVYRQVAEALANIEKHAGAKSVRVSVRAQDGGVQGEIVDDGQGFLVSERDHLPGHLGLLALNERALLAGGWCNVISEPGAGARVEFWIPLPR
ncbi:MAG TPA: GAF domain-containing protein [Candidatus Acidoferrum sp.]|nr:GAF domain-containing protein [Candidatus Acidoferrum sp.]